MNEHDIQRAVLDYLERHPKVGWVRRMNSGSAKRNGTYVRFGFVGLSDIIGQLKDGRFLAIECKRGVGGASASVPQETFIAQVRCNGGIAGIVRSVEDAEALLTDVKHRSVSDNVL